MATRSRLPVAVVWLLVAPVIPAMLPGQGVTHVEVRQGWSRNPATDAEMTGRLREAASAYRQYAPIPRIAVYNIGYPSSSAEYESLNGYGAIVVTVVAQDSAEVPLARLYFRSAAGVETELPVVVFSCGRVAPADSVVASTFGKNRCDALHFFPVLLATTQGDLLADFAINRRGFRIQQFSGETPPALVGFPIRQPSGPPAGAAWMRFLTREFPSFSPLLPVK
jgi:hypothetical protein